jgi:outer membrane protein insertion porin family
MAASASRSWSNEGRRLAISGLEFVGTDVVKPSTVVGAMKTKPEGFFFFARASSTTTSTSAIWASAFRSCTRDSGMSTRACSRTRSSSIRRSGKGKLRAVTIDEGPQYRIGTFEIAGNRVVPGEDLRKFCPFDGNESDAHAAVVRAREARGARRRGRVRRRASGMKATQKVGNRRLSRQRLHLRQVYPVVERRFEGPTRSPR